MRRNIKITVLILFSLLFVMVFAEAAWAESDDGNGAPDKEVLLSLSVTDKDSDGTGVHADPATFRKNYCLSVEQKSYAIKEIESVVSRIIKPEMSDLEKYYTLALWEYKRVKYDNDFWSGRYHFEYYSHQWDAYGALKEKSVCAGMSIFYANLCHAADLPCKFVRLYPKTLDHTINYIPDINGNAYYVDVTEDCFLMSDESCLFADNVDKEFAHITNDCTDQTFDFECDYGVTSASIKDCLRGTYNDWFKRNALHEDTDNIYVKEYEEKGSGKVGTHYASYHDYESQCFSGLNKNPGIWFLEDFYENPEAISSKILNKEFDEQLLDISAVKDSYGSVSAVELEEDIASDIIIRYFPSSENGEVVPWADNLKTNIDYEIKCKTFDQSKREATVAIKGLGDYTGTYLMQVKLKKANPMKVKGKTVKIKYSKLKKKAQSVKRAKVIKVSKAKGEMLYNFVSATKGKKDFEDYFFVDLYTGKVTVNKGLKKGTYKVVVEVKDAGNAKYGTSGWKKVTFKVKVK